MEKSPKTAKPVKSASKSPASARKAADKPAKAGMKPAPTTAAKRVAKAAATPAVKSVVTAESAVSLAPVAADSDNAPARMALKKKDLLARVVQESGARKADARTVTEAVLKVLGEALSAGEDVHVPPLGKLKVNKRFERAGAEIMVMKLRRDGAGAPGEKTAADPLAEADD